MLHRPVPAEPFFIHADACNTGLGPMFTQRIGGVERIIHYGSKKLKPAQKNCNTTEKECLAVKWAIDKFRPYVEGSHFTVITDHSALRWLFQKKNPTGRLGRWIQELSQYDFNVEHRAEKLNVIPDALSRVYEDDEDVTDACAINFQEQTKDKWYIKRVHQIIRFPRRYKDWNLVDGRIYRYRPNYGMDEIVPDLDSWKLVIPEEKREDILREMHDDPHAAHPGIEKHTKSRNSIIGPAFTETHGIT